MNRQDMRERNLEAPDLGDYSQDEIDDANEKAQFNILGNKFAIYDYFNDEPFDLGLCESLAELLVCREEYQQENVDKLRELVARRMNKIIRDEVERII